MWSDFFNSSTSRSRSAFPCIEAIRAFALPYPNVSRTTNVEALFDEDA
jgi:hypothetical protein